MAGQVRVWSRRLSLALQPATTQPILLTWTYHRVCVGFRIPGVRVCVHRRGGLLPLEAALLSYRTGLRTHCLPLVPSFWPAPALLYRHSVPSPRLSTLSPLRRGLGPSFGLVLAGWPLKSAAHADLFLLYRVRRAHTYIAL